MKTWIAACVVGVGIALTQTVAQTTPQAAPVVSVPVPREKVNLACVDEYFKSERLNFLLQDENYVRCTLRVPLALRQRWPGRRTYYVIPRVSASLYAVKDGKGRWVPLTPLSNPGNDPFHRTLESNGYKQVELVGVIGKLTERAGEAVPDTVSAGGKLSVCVSPVLRGESPCATFDITARFRVYQR